jgi:serine protease Do
MNAYLLKITGLAAMVLLLHTQGSAQQTETMTMSSNEERDTAKFNDYDEIVIKRKNDKNAKITVEIKDGQVFVNGKPVNEFNDDNLSVRKKKIMVLDGRSFNFSGPGNFDMDMDNLAIPPVPPVPAFSADSADLVAPGSPFRSWDSRTIGGNSWSGNSNRPFLGVTSSKTEKDDGARVKEVAKGSAAEKAGIKEGDVITRVDEISVTGPQSLSAAVHKYKPEDKVTLTYKRDGKEIKTTLTLGKSRNTNFYFSMPEVGDMNLNNIMPRIDGYSYGYGSYSRPRLGIKAQDTEDGKGVKVLEVGDESAAEKAGIKEGDIITRFDGKEVNSATTLSEYARAARDKVSVKINLIRDGKPQELEVKFPRKLKTADL